MQMAALPIESVPMVHVMTRAWSQQIAPVRKIVSTVNVRNLISAMGHSIVILGGSALKVSAKTIVSESPVMAHYCANGRRENASKHRPATTIAAASKAVFAKPTSVAIPAWSLRIVRAE